MCLNNRGVSRGVREASLQEMAEFQDPCALNKELAALKSLDHPNIIEFIEDGHE